jgi:hypothetical protein
MRSLARCFLTALLSAVPAYAVDVTSCGQEVAAGETAILAQDLVCDAATPAAVRLQSRSRLDLNGFSISGVPGDAPAAGIHCERSCTIDGPGTVSNMGSAIDAGQGGGTGRVIARNLTVSGSGSGISAVRMKLMGVVSTGNGLGIDAYTLRADDTEVRGNTGTGVRAVRLGGVGLTTSSNGVDGVIAIAGARLRNFTALGNGRWGLWSGARATLSDATLTGNTSGDVATAIRPRLLNTVCETSVVADPQAINSSLGTWGVCLND